MVTANSGGLTCVEGQRRQCQRRALKVPGGWGWQTRRPPEASKFGLLQTPFQPPLKRLLTMFLGTMSSKLEQTITRKRINYTLYEELDAGDMERTRDVYRWSDFRG
ncbi:hypothetical protein ES332_D05G327300v1 [Gossypium tomentosum]|uniref:Uncharacterized protein n=1 Tax=Gossypium tomentosum TaxID=34277 RepID=A0A5D2L264_GOSTO|nr:hypothetical protein ES332_D05G327300v1 [Gossypium tomentosum]